MYRTCVACHRVEPRFDQRRSSASTHKPHSLISCVAAYGSVHRRGSEERLRRRGARCDVRLPCHVHTRSIRYETSTCTVTTRDCRSSVNFVLRAWMGIHHYKVTHPAPRGASGHSSLQGDTSGAPWSVGCVAEHGARSSLDLKGDLVADRLTLYTCVSEYRTCVSSHRVERHASVPSAEPKKKKEKAESLVVVVSSSLPRSPNLPPPAPRVAP